MHKPHTALNDVNDFAERLAAALEAVRYLVDVGDSADVINASTIPIFMLEPSVESMGLVVDTANEVGEAEKKQAILALVTSFLLVLPLEGSSIGAASLATLGRMITLVSELGNAALAIYSVVEDQNNTIYEIFAALLRSPKSFQVAGAKKRGMTAVRSQAWARASATRSARLTESRLPVFTVPKSAYIFLFFLGSLG